MKNIHSLLLSLVVIVSMLQVCVAQDGESTLKDLLNSMSSNGGKSRANQIEDDTNPMKAVQTMLKQMLSSDAVSSLIDPDGPGVYQMTRNATNLGINVLGGLVKVDRIREPGKPRRLSVRILGMPIYNQGFRSGQRRPTDDFGSSGSESVPESGADSGSDSGSSDKEEEDSLTDP